VNYKGSDLWYITESPYWPNGNSRTSKTLTLGNFLFGIHYIYLHRGSQFIDSIVVSSILIGLVTVTANKKFKYYSTYQNY
jgi:hypothetical protein